MKQTNRILSFDLGFIPHQITSPPFIKILDLLLTQVGGGISSPSLDKTQIKYITSPSFPTLTTT